MRRPIFALILFSAAASMFAQQPAPEAGGRGGGRGGRGGRGGAFAPQPPPPLFFKETWKNVEGNIPMTQDSVTNANLTVNMYGSGKQDFNITAEGNVPHIWTGLCEAGCAITLSDKANFVDLTGKARIKWYMKTSGFHEVRPVLKLADGTWLIGDHADADTFDYRETEFYPSQVHWMKLDVTPKVLTKGTILEKVDLSKVDQIGFADLTPGSGHGSGGYSDVGWIEVYGKPVAR